jgi:hypothetical protein
MGAGVVDFRRIGLDAAAPLQSRDGRGRRGSGRRPPGHDAHGERGPLAPGLRGKQHLRRALGPLYVRHRRDGAARMV